MASELGGVGGIGGGLRMPQELPDLARPQRAPALRESAAPEAPAAGGFSGTLKEFLSDVNQTQLTSDATFQRFVRGEAELHEVALAAREAEISLRLTLEIRDRLVQAYQEVSRMNM